MFKELKEFINEISKEEHPESEMSDDLKKKIKLHMLRHMVQTV